MMMFPNLKKEKEKGKSQQEDAPPSQPRWSKEGDEDDLEGSPQKQKREELGLHRQ